MSPTTGMPAFRCCTIRAGDRGKPQAASSRPAPTVVRGVLLMPTTSGMLLDIAGREVLALNAGVNNIGWLAPGVYFVRPEQPAENDGPSAVTKVVIQR